MDTVLEMNPRKCQYFFRASPQLVVPAENSFLPIERLENIQKEITNLISTKCSCGTQTDIRDSSTQTNPKDFRCSTGLKSLHKRGPLSKERRPNSQRIFSELTSTSNERSIKKSLGETDETRTIGCSTMRTRPKTEKILSATGPVEKIITDIEEIARNKKIALVKKILAQSIKHI
ncbi:uncharacterized protein LOC136027216 [Artemia franciscana]|uniref:uncharacterized protein LOC136027216 n=1 Tax=Artemia franciscana TaxID=6661 RepID=UPI0032D9F37C